MNKIIKKINNRGIIQKFIFGIFFCALFFGAYTAQAASLSKAPSNLGLAGYWSFNDGSGTLASDSSGNSNDGTLTNISNPAISTSGWNSGKFGKGIVLDGTNDYIAVGDKTSLKLSGSTISISAWVRHDSGTFKDWEAIATKGDNTYRLTLCGSVGGCGGSSVYNGFYFALNGGSVISFGTSFAPVTGRWYHVVVTYDGTNAYLYVDGIQVATDSGSDTISNDTTSFYIGENSGATGRQWTGGIDEVRVYSRAISVTEVKNLYNSGARTKKAVTNNGLVGYWPFNDGGGTTIGDASGNGNTGTMTSFSSPATTTSGWLKGKLGGALMFDGVDDTIAISDSTSLNLMSTTTNTFSSWIYMTAYPVSGDSYTHQIIGDENGTCGSTIWRIGSQGSITYQKRIGVNFRNSPSNDNDTQNNTDLPLNKWTHIAVTTDGSNIRFYINGLLDTTNAFTVTPQSSSCTWNIGQAVGPSGRFFEGAMDDIRLYNRTLSGDEILNLSKIGAVTRRPPNNLGLIGYWPFNEGTGTKAGDASGNSVEGTLTNISSPATTTSGWGSGRFAKAIIFDGSDDYVTAGNVSSMNMGTSDWTTSMWVKTSNVAAQPVVVGKETFVGGGTDAWYMELRNNGHLLAGMYKNGRTHFATADDGASVSDNKWHHIVAVWNRSGNLLRYVDGILTGAALDISTESAQSISNTREFQIGGRDEPSDPLRYTGSIDDVRVYNRALSATDVFNLYNYGR